MLNRGALILRYKEPAVRWINECDDDDGSDEVSLQMVNEERTVYLIAEGAGVDGIHLEEWLTRNYGPLFEMELEGWYTDPELWPLNRTYNLFREWFVPEYHSALIDLGSGTIFDDEA